MFPSSANKPMITGMGWYSEEQYALLLQYAADVDNLPETYEEWRAITEKTLYDLRQRGIPAVKMKIDVMALKAWCEANNLPLNGENRTRYVTTLTRRRFPTPRARI